MWAADRPDRTAKQTAIACVSTAHDDRPWKQAIMKSLSHIERNSTAYRDAAVIDSLHTMEVEDFPLPPGLSKKDMLALYKRRLASSQAPAQAAEIYRRLRALGPVRRCAYCRSAPARQLDHFMPKDSFAALAIDPWNLVPCCGFCNLKLLADWEREPSKRRLHPYFMPQIGRWLSADLDIGDPRNGIEPIIVYRAEPDRTQLGEELSNRVREQFNRLDLGATLADAAASTLEDAKWLLRLSITVPREVARANLIDQARVHLAQDPNHPTGVLYEALAINDAFVDYYSADGFQAPDREIPAPKA